MKERLIKLIIADRTRVITLCVSFSIAVAGSIATRLLGVELTSEHNAMITLVVTLTLGWIFEAYAAEANAKGGAAVQTLLQKENPDLDVDRYVGPETVKAVKNALTK